MGRQCEALAPKITFNHFPLTLIYMHMKTNYCVPFWLVAVSVTKRKTILEENMFISPFGMNDAFFFFDLC